MVTVAPCAGNKLEAATESGTSGMVQQKFCGHLTFVEMKSQQKRERERRRSRRRKGMIMSSTYTKQVIAIPNAIYEYDYYTTTMSSPWTEAMDLSPVLVSYHRPLSQTT